MSIIGRVIDRGIVGPVIGRVIGDDQSALQQIQAILAGSESALFNPAISSTVFQNYYGGNLGGDAGSGDPVGLMLDVSRGLSLGDNIWTSANVNEAANWTDNGNSTWTSNPAQSGELDLVYGVGDSGVFQVDLQISGQTEGVVAVFVRSAGDAGNERVSSLISDESGVFRLVVKVSPGTTGYSIRVYASSSDATVGLIAREIQGNHAYQTVSSDRPTLQNSGSLWEVVGDGISKHLLSDLDMSGSDEATFVVGAERQSNGHPVCYGNISSGTAWSLSFFSTSNRSAMASRATSYKDATIDGALSAQRYVFSGRSKISTPVVEHRRNRSSWSQNTATQGAGANYGNQQLALFGNPSGPSFNTTKIQAVCVSGRKLTDEEIYTIEGYISSLSGVAL